MKKSEPVLTERAARTHAHRQVGLWIGPKIYQMERQFNKLSENERRLLTELGKIQEYHERRDGVTIFR